MAPPPAIPFATAVRDFELEGLPRGELIAYLAILATAVALFVRFARRSPLLRCARAAADGRSAPYRKGKVARRSRRPPPRTPSDA